jgi:hypothetical protein
MDIMADQVINRATARGLQADARRNRLLVGWVVVRDQPRPGQFIARLVTNGPTRYVLQADTLVELCQCRLKSPQKCRLKIPHFVA